MTSDPLIADVVQILKSISDLPEEGLKKTAQLIVLYLAKEILAMLKGEKQGGIWTDEELREQKKASSAR